MARAGLITIILILLLSSCPNAAESLSLELTPDDQGLDLVLGFKQESFLLNYRHPLSHLGGARIELGIKPEFLQTKRGAVELNPYLSLDLGRGLTLGLYGESAEIAGLALYSAVGDVALSTKGTMLFFRGEYAVGNIGLRGHLQLTTGELAVQPWLGKTREIYFPDWSLLTASGYHSGYLPGSNFYMEVRRRFPEELILSEGFGSLLNGSRLSPGIFLTAEYKSFSFRIFKQFPQEPAQGYNALSLGYKAGLFRANLNFKFFSTGMEVMLLTRYRADEVTLLTKLYLVAPKLSYGMGVQWGF